MIGTTVINTNGVITSCTNNNLDLRDRGANTAFLNSLNYIKEQSTKDKYYGKSIVYLHNGAKFDIKVILEMITSLSNDKEVDFQIINVTADGTSTIFQLECIYEGHKFSLRDSFKVLGASVDNLGKMYLEGKVAKLTIDHNEFNNIYNAIGHSPLLNELTQG